MNYITLTVDKKLNWRNENQKLKTLEYSNKENNKESIKSNLNQRVYWCEKIIYKKNMCYSFSVGKYIFTVWISLYKL